MNAMSLESLPGMAIILRNTPHFSGDRWRHESSKIEVADIPSQPLDSYESEILAGGSRILSVEPRLFLGRWTGIRRRRLRR